MRRLSKNRLLIWLQIMFFGSQAIVWPAPVEVGAWQNAEVKIPSIAAQADIPGSLGYVQRRFISPPKKISQRPAALPSVTPVIFHVQDAHTSHEAQIKIKNILHHLVDEYGVRLIFREGGVRELDADLLRFFDREENNARVAGQLAREGLIGGTELFQLEFTGQNPDSDLRVFGVEDPDLYRRDLEAFRAVMQAKETTQGFLERFKSTLLSLSSHLFSKELKDFFRECLFYQGVPDEWMRHVDAFKSQAAKTLQIDLSDPGSQTDWPQLVRLIQARALEKKWNQALVQREAKLVIEAMREQSLDEKWIVNFEAIVEKGVVEDSAFLGPRHFLEALYQRMANGGFSFAPFNALRAYLGMVVLQQELQPGDLFDEIELLTDQILNKLAATAEEKALLALYEKYRMLTKVLNLAVTAAEYAAIQEEARVFSPSALLEQLVQIQTSSNKAGQLTPRENFDAIPDDVFNRAMEFYALAARREQAIFEKMKAVMQSEKQAQAILITGGFHADGMAEFFKNNFMSFVQIMPRITALDLNPQAGGYFQTMTLQGDYLTKRSYAMTPTPTEAGGLETLNALYGPEIAYHFAGIESAVVGSEVANLCATESFTDVVTSITLSAASLSGNLQPVLSAAENIAVMTIGGQLVPDPHHPGDFLAWTPRGPDTITAETLAAVAADMTATLDAMLVRHEARNENVRSLKDRFTGQLAQLDQYVAQKARTKSKLNPNRPVGVIGSETLEIRVVTAADTVGRVEAVEVGTPVAGMAAPQDLLVRAEGESGIRAEGEAGDTGARVPYDVNLRQELEVRMASIEAYFGVGNVDISALAQKFFDDTMPYFLDPNTMNLTYGLPRTAYAPDDPANFTWSNVAEWGYYLNTLMMAWDMGWLPDELYEEKVATTLTTLRNLQLNPEQSYHGLFYPFYYVKNNDPFNGFAPGTLDIQPIHDFDLRIPSVDNAILTQALFVLEQHALENGIPNIASKSREIAMRMDYSIFWVPELKQYTHAIDLAARYRAGTIGKPPSGDFTRYPDGRPVTWDIAAQESRIMVTVAYANGSVPPAIFQQSLDGLTYGQATYTDTQGFTIEAVPSWDGSLFASYVDLLYAGELNEDFIRLSAFPVSFGHLMYAQSRGMRRIGFSDAMAVLPLPGFGQEIGGPPSLMNKDWNRVAVPGQITPYALIMPLALLQGDPDPSYRLLHERLVLVNFHLAQQLSQTRNYSNQPGRFGFSSLVASDAAQDANLPTSYGVLDQFYIVSALGNHLLQQQGRNDLPHYYLLNSAVAEAQFAMNEAFRSRYPREDYENVNTAFSIRMSNQNQMIEVLDKTGQTVFRKDYQPEGAQIFQSFLIGGDGHVFLVTQLNNGQIDIAKLDAPTITARYDGVEVTYKKYANGHLKLNILRQDQRSYHEVDIRADPWRATENIRTIPTVAADGKNFEQIATLPYVSNAGGLYQTIMIGVADGGTQVNGFENAIYVDMAKQGEGGGLAFDNFATPQIETANLSAKTELTFAVTANTNEAQVQVISRDAATGEETKAYVNVSSIETQTEMVRIPLSNFAAQGVDLTRVSVVLVTNLKTGRAQLEIHTKPFQETPIEVKTAALALTVTRDRVHGLPLAAGAAPFDALAMPALFGKANSAQTIPVAARVVPTGANFPGTVVEIEIATGEKRFLIWPLGANNPVRQLEGKITPDGSRFFFIGGDTIPRFIDLNTGVEVKPHLELTEEPGIAAGQSPLARTILNDRFAITTIRNATTGKLQILITPFDGFAATRLDLLDFQTGISLEQYRFKAGAFQAKADSDAAVILLANGQRIRVQDAAQAIIDLLHPLDINGDHFISPIDALVIINYLNEKGAGAIQILVLPPYYDANRDGFATPIDVLNVINDLNAFGSREIQIVMANAAEGEFAAAGMAEGEAAATTLTFDPNAMATTIVTFMGTHAADAASYGISSSTITSTWVEERSIEPTFAAEVAEETAEETDALYDLLAADQAPVEPDLLSAATTAEQEDVITMLAPDIATVRPSRRARDLRAAAGRFGQRLEARDDGLTAMAEEDLPPMEQLDALLRRLQYPSSVPSVLHIAEYVTERTLPLILPAAGVRAALDLIEAAQPQDQAVLQNYEQIVAVIQEGLGEEFNLLLPGRDRTQPINLVMPVTLETKPRSLQILLSILALPQDHVTLMVQSSPEQEASPQLFERFLEEVAGFEETLHAFLKIRAPEKLVRQIEVIATNQAGVVQGVTRVFDKSQNDMARGVVANDTVLLSKMPVSGAYRLMFSPQELDEEVALLLAAAYLRASKIDERSFEIANLIEWMQSKGIQSDALSARIAAILQSIDALAILEAAA